MNTIERGQRNAEIAKEKFEPVPESVTPVHNVPPVVSWGYNPMLVCPMPPLTGYTDALRQFYREGVPQYRVLAPTLK